jgi:hypothetical protein
LNNPSASRGRGDICGAYRVGDGGVGLPVEFDVPEIRALVFFLIE